MYARLQHLQGRLNPKFYGTAFVTHSTGERHKAFLLELVDGKHPDECKKEEMEAWGLKEKLNAAVGLFSEKCVVHRDLYWRNVLITKNGIKIIDFGEATIESEKEAYLVNRGDVIELLNRLY
ncbi:hypothetical protein GQ43DRAFT_314754 [Delitschia confertaspora ATCC 74209]|uniref:Protein kinase domain-containing protein n=1 Tax=Delitschia confertaspora ATCC 74209 TaxID=1513339 RepID=A0A9P4MTQ4_9PLEO|nr:hypothetical protein GQ43DRAFT_314754 [Delitschia confertaspora ATCC 74209]